jgi:uncharacterized protein YwgA
MAVVTRPLLLRLILDSLNISNIETLDKRKVMQKLIYLLQAFGVNMLYGFRWDSYGPYSVELADDAKAVLRERKDEYDKLVKESGFHFSEETLSVIKDFGQQIGDKVKEDLGFGELLASVHFADKMFSKNGKAEGFIKNSKPHLYSKDKYDMAKEICSTYLNGSS